MRIKVFISCVDQGWAEAVGAALAAAEPLAGGAGTVVVCVDASSHPDVVLMDSVAGASGTRERLARAAAAAAAGVLVAYERCTRELLVEALECGARGCTLKASPLPLLLQALCAIRRGETWYSSTALLQALRPESPAIPVAVAGEHELTPREQEILHLTGLGLSNKEIGRQLKISDQTVKTHLHRVYVKLNRSGRYKAFLAHPAPWQAGAASVGAPLRQA